MAKRQVVEIECSRCDRKEYREEPGSNGDQTPALTVLLHVGEPYALRFEDLCSPCASTVRGHLESIGKKIEGVSPVRGKKEKEAPKEHPVNGNGAKKKNHAVA